MSELIFGYTWEELDALQHGHRPNQNIIKHAPNPTATPNDKDLLAEHGRAGLESLQLFGVLDRLNTSGLLEILP